MSTRIESPGLLKESVLPRRSAAQSGFALLKRGITGSFHSVSKAHLHRYCDEFSFRWNERKATDSERTVKAIALSVGPRLMYKEPVRRRA